jgi:catechol 2,3-dioxygenase-like lactoylglutathione lyase family enzyme
MDNVAIMVEDLDAAVAFFTELGLELEGRMSVQGELLDRIVGLTDAHTDVAMVRMPDGHGRLELIKYLNPAPLTAEPKLASPHTLGMGRIMFAVDDIHDTVERLRKHGAELVGEIVNYEGFYLLCYLRGPEGIIVALAEELSA